LYVQDDSAFNEAFATAVEMEGLRRWRIQNSQPVSVDDNGQRTAVQRLLRDGRRRLIAVYASDRDPDAKRMAKQEVLADLAKSYDALLVEWRLAGLKPQPYASLFRQGLNNASLAALATYDDYVPAFGELLRQCGAWLACFYVRAETLAEMARPERTARLQELVRIAASGRN
jgi:predicted aminopeptidase